MMRKKKNFEDKSRYRLLPKLVNLGLSKQEAEIYLTLLEEGPLPAKEVAKKINILPHAVYRTTKKLESKKLVAVLKTSPLTFQTLPPQLALPSFAKEKAVYLQKEAEKTAKILAQKKSAAVPTKIDLIFSRHEIFTLFDKMVEKTKKELLIISIGEPIPQNSLLSTKRAYEKGVVIRMIAHKYDGNREILENFKKNGWQIRHFPDWGFHLVVFDGKRSLLSVNNPKDTRERVGMQIFSEGLSKALRDYFYSVWEKAVKI